MVKINSELPISLLADYNKELNDFDFVLFHLYRSDENYRNYFNEMRETHPDRMMILDNSAYEFFVKGEELNLDEYVPAIKDLNPDFYILPDVLMDYKKTMKGIEDFEKKYKGDLENYFNNIEMSAPQPFAVAQGKTLQEFNNCLCVLLKKGYKNIALPFHNRFFKEDFQWVDGDITYEFAHNGYQICTEDVRYAMGRCQWLKEYGDDLLVDNGHPVYEHLHFLGSHCPAEKAYYNIFFRGTPGVITMDTGYPVKCGIEGVELGKETEKPKTIIDDFMNNKFDKKTIKTICNNVNIFKNY